MGHDYYKEVRKIRPTQLDEWLASEEPRLRNTTYNRYAGFLKQLFQLAVKDRIIAESPCKELRTPWKRPQTPIRHIPTVEQFQKIVASIRSQPFSDHAEDSADFVEFLGLAGLGQAEAASLTWGDIDWKQGRMRIRRRKTDTVFYVPIYDHLRPLLERLRKGRGAMFLNSRVFKIKDAKKALTSACARLGLLRVNGNDLWLLLVTSDDEIVQLPVCEPTPCRRRVIKRHIKNARHVIAVWEEDRKTGVSGTDPSLTCLSEVRDHADAFAALEGLKESGDIGAGTALDDIENAVIFEVAKGGGKALPLVEGVLVDAEHAGALEA